MKKIFAVHNKIAKETGIKIFKFGEKISSVKPPFAIFQLGEFSHNSKYVGDSGSCYRKSGNVTYDLYTNKLETSRQQGDSELFESFFYQQYKDLYVELISTSISYDTLATGERLNRAALIVMYSFYQDNIRRAA